MKKYIKSTFNAQNVEPICYDIFDDYWIYDYELPDFETMKDDYAYGYDITRKVYDNVINFFESLDEAIDKGQIQTYVDHGETFLQLSDRRIFFEIDIEDSEYIYLVIEQYIKRFEDDYDIKVYQFGRSGRHICVDFTIDNIINYDNLCSEWGKYENEFLEEMNAVITNTEG